MNTLSVRHAAKTLSTTAVPLTRTRTSSWAKGYPSLKTPTVALAYKRQRRDLSRTTSGSKRIPYASAMLFDTLGVDSLLSQLSRSRSGRQHLRIAEPSLRTIEEEDKYRLIAHVPGVPASEVKVTISDEDAEGGELRLTATDPRTKQTVLERSVRFSEEMNPDTTMAWCQDGVLEVTMEKRAPPQPTSVEVQATVPPESDMQRYEVRREVPGISAKDVSVQVLKDTLSIEAQAGGSDNADGDDKAVQIASQFFVSFSQTIPDDVVVDDISAYCVDGILTVRLPKSTESKTIDIEVMSECPELEKKPDEWIHVALLNVPGVSGKDIAVNVTPGYLKISVQGANGKQLERYVVMPDDMEDLASVRAVCQHGQLRIAFPRAALKQPSVKEIAVSHQRPELSA